MFLLNHLAMHTYTFINVESINNYSLYEVCSILKTMKHKLFGCCHVHK